MSHGPPSVDPRHVKKIVTALYAVCTLLVVLDLGDFVGFGYHKHGHYGFEGWVGFHAVYGFLSCVGLVVAAAQLRKLLMRAEDYYDD